MPIMNGFLLCEKIKKMIQDKEIPYIFLVANTANVIEEDEKKYSNFDDKFTKPFNKKRIVEILNKYCKLRKKDAFHKRSKESYALLQPPKDEKNNH